MFYFKRIIKISFIIFSLFALLFSQNKLDNNNLITVWNGFKTFHWSNDSDTNNDNKILGIMWRKKFLARFTNSWHQKSWIIGTGWDKRIRPFKNIYLDLRFAVGVSTGYKDMSNLGGNLHLVPGFVPSFGFGYNIKNKLLVGLDMIYIPTGHGGVFIYGTSISF